ncbi:glycosyltransferase family 2 protein [uncultured Roseobacter sp.]|uniref:glycosyltransferase family 2 protein n=1 Tax=uncultured Roseobacter sp. TaxID=114847 RepID=UPI00260FF765|nr:glycosyltransferase family 2 protein [uncultured Roseobacter sp.]
MAGKRTVLNRYRLRLRRKRLLWRAFRSRRDLTPVADRTASVTQEQILLFSTVRNEMMRLPWFMKHYRALGVGHFIFVDNDSDDGTAEWLAGQPDTSVWATASGYRAARFGMDWLTSLQRRFAPGHWTLTVDADELLIYPGHDNCPLPDFVKRLERFNQKAMGAIMLDLYPKGRPDEHTYLPEQNPLDVLPWFDAWGYQVQRQARMGNLWLQGGPRARCFFADDPARAPTLNKIPLVRWDRAFVYVNSTHNALPAWLNETWKSHGGVAASGVLLHTKFLPGTAERAAQEKARREHFQQPEAFDAYYDALIRGTDMWEPGSARYTCWRQMVDLGLMSELR